MEVLEAHPFRVIRDADMVIQELEASDLLEMMEQTVRQRRFGSVVLLSINDSMPARIRQLLLENLEIDRNDMYTIDGPMGYSELMPLHNIDRYDIKDPPFKPYVPRRLRFDEDGNIFNAIREGDILLHHPYDSFTPVIQFLKTASNDPDVLAMKQTLYRVGKNPPAVDALLEAAENGKQVAVLVELKARFDEESNIGWARTLEKEGVHVVYGLLGLKTHSKIALVIRKEGDGIRRYLHMATGNYNAITAQVYEDIGMFTVDEDLGADATDLFNYLTGYSSKNEYRKLLVAPINLRSRMVELIKREIESHKINGQGHLIFKINSLVDKKMIQLLYQASQAGVQVDLFIRGLCCLRPGMPGISDNIQVTSIVGRFLEHSRIYYFRNNGNEEIFLGSADLMPRNIDRRVEVLFPVQDPQMIKHIYSNILVYYAKDNVKARRMLPDGTYIRVEPHENEPPFNIQNWFITTRR
jgi:polyphosphate kinase